MHDKSVDCLSSDFYACIGAVLSAKVVRHQREQHSLRRHGLRRPVPEGGVHAGQRHLAKDEQASQEFRPGIDFIKLHFDKYVWAEFLSWCNELIL
jgi:hypothetical protein